MSANKPLDKKDLPEDEEEEAKDPNALDDLPTATSKIDVAAEEKPEHPMHEVRP